MATPVDPHDLAAIEALAKSGFWEQAGLVETRRLQELLKQQRSLGAGSGLRYEDAQAAPQLPEIERELIEDILTLFDDNGLSQEQTLSLIGQLSVLIELVKQKQAQYPTS